MRNKRFIFTIDSKTNQYIDEIARQHSLSKSKALKHIIEEQKLVGDNVGIDTEKAFINRFGSASNLYSTPNISQILNSPDFIDFISNEDADFLIFVAEDLIVNQPDNDGLKLLFAKLLKHRGHLTEAESVLAKIYDEHNLEKYLLMFGIAIQMGEIAVANHLLNRCKEIINVNQNTCSNLIEQLQILIAEFYWISNGVSVAENYVDKIISNYINSKKDLLLGKLYCLKGEFLRDKGDYFNAEKNYKLSLQYFEKYPFEGNYLARIFKGLGSVYKNRGNCKLAYDHLLIALNIAKKFGDKITESGVLASMAGLYFTEGKSDQGIRVLKNKVEIGQMTNSLREKFYANYDLSLATIEKGDLGLARNIIEDNYDHAVKFKRAYYLKMWKGYIETQANLENGINIIKSCKIEALNANEDKRVHLADYLLAASYNQFDETKNKAHQIITTLINNPAVSNQLKSNLNYLVKNPKGIKAI